MTQDDMVNAVLKGTATWTRCDTDTAIVFLRTGVMVKLLRAKGGAA